MHERTIEIQKMSKEAIKRNRKMRIHFMRQGIFDISPVTMGARFPDFWVWKPDADKITKVFRKAEKQGVTIHYTERRSNSHRVQWSDIIIQGPSKKVSKFFVTMDEHITRMDEHEARMKEHMED